MTITIYVNESSLEELSNFLKAGIKYEHTIEYSLNLWTLSTTLHINTCHVHLFYDDYVALKNWQMLPKVEPSSPPSITTG